MIRTATIGRHTSLAGLARHLFETQGSPDSQRRAEAALLAANPTLAEPGGFARGATILVPEIAGSRRTDAPPLAHDALNEFGRMVEQFTKAAPAAFEAEILAAKESVRMLEAPETVKLLRERHPELLAQLPEVLKAAQNRVDEAAATGADVTEALQRATADLSALAGRAERPGDGG